MSERDNKAGALRGEGVRMGLDRNELAARFAVALAGREGCAVAASEAVAYTDALLAALSPAPVVGAPHGVDSKEQTFTCPKCGSHGFGTSNCTSPYSAWVGHCDNHNCGFSWPRELDDAKYFTPAATVPTPYAPKVGDKIRTTEEPTTDKWDGTLIVLKDGFVTFAGVPHIDAIRTDDSGKDPHASGFYVAAKCVYLGPATAAERAAAGLSVDAAQQPTPAIAPTPAVEPRRTVGAVVRYAGCDYFVVREGTDGPFYEHRPLGGSVSGAGSDSATHPEDEFVRWGTREECARHGVPFVDRTPPAAALTEEERADLRDAIWKERTAWLATGADQRSEPDVYANAAAAWFAKRGGAK